MNYISGNPSVLMPFRALIDSDPQVVKHYGAAFKAVLMPFRALIDSDEEILTLSSQIVLCLNALPGID